MKNKDEKELSMLRKENEILKKTIMDYMENEKYYLSLVKQYEEARDEARAARDNFNELYKKLKEAQ